ncbi:MAG: hypothetical protein BroJett026_15790 [Betaproteobacteria bacterium]|nr:MAG: hypothetical protein BroJett026_15790 [Betaproteobacteria bacterium]
MPRVRVREFRAPLFRPPSVPASARRRPFRAMPACALAALALAIVPPLAAQPASNGGEAAPAVVVRPLSQVVVRQRSDAPAGVASLNEARIAAEIPAAVLEIPARPGATLSRGAVVVRLDPRDYEIAVQRAQAGVEAAQARLRLAETQLARSRQLATQNFISSEALNQRETELDVVRADLRVQQAALEGARRNLAKTVLRAPFRAIVVARNASVGELAQPGTPLVTLLDADRVEVVATVQVAEAPTLRGAADVEFVTREARHPVALARLSPAIDRDSRTVEARFAFTDGRAPVGAEGRVVWTNPRAFLPPELAVRRGDQIGVFVVDGDVARFVPLPDAQEGRPAPIDLAPTTRIAVEGHRALRTGQKVTVATPAPGAR